MSDIDPIEYAMRAIDDSAMAISKLPNTVEFLRAIVHRNEARLMNAWESMGADERCVARRAVVIFVVITGSCAIWPPAHELLVRSLEIAGT